VSAVRYADPEPQGLAAVLGGLIDANLARDPSRHALLRPGVVVIDAQDAGAAATLTFGDGWVEVAAGVHPAPQVRVRANGADLIDLTNAPLRVGLPNPSHPHGRALVAAIASRRVRIDGLLLHPALVRRLTMLLSVG
jgi:hypothetical protein